MSTNPSDWIVVSDAMMPAARRVSDILRSRTRRPRRFIIDDAENIAQALSHGVHIDALYAVAGGVAEWAASRAMIDEDVPRYLLSRRVARAVFGAEKVGRIFAIGGPVRRPAAIADVLRADGDVVVLDGVRLAGNIGAVIRTASGLGAAGVVVLDSGIPTAFDRRLIRASRGLVFSLPVAIESRESFVIQVRRTGLRCVALTPRAADADVDDIDRIGERLAVVLGGERDGVSVALSEICQDRFVIPMKDEVESLNVSAAAAIVLHERRRTAREPVASR